LDFLLARRFALDAEMVLVGRYFDFSSRGNDCLFFGGGILERTNAMTEYVRPNVTADMLIPNEKGEILLILRRNDPFKGCYAIPGGFLEVHQETVEECALREAREETGLTVEIDRLIGVYSHPKRDPRWHNITAAYLAKPITLQQAVRAQAGDDAGEILWIDPRSERYKKIPIAFDHRQIIADAMGLLEVIYVKILSQSASS